MILCNLVGNLLGKCDYTALGCRIVWIGKVSYNPGSRADIYNLSAFFALIIGSTDIVKR